MATRLLFAVFLICTAARAQDEPAQEREAPPEAIYPAAMTIDDARMNFATVVESFISARSPKGTWPLKQKSANRILNLRHEKNLPKTVRTIGAGLYIGRVVLLEVDENIPIQAEFTVDLGSPRWQVKRMRLVGKPPAASPAGKAAAKAREAQPAPEAPPAAIGEQP